MTDEKKGILAATIAYIIFGFSYLFSKMALNIVDPILLLCSRFTITFIALNILVFAGVMKLNLRGKNLLGPIMMGVLQPVLYFILENYGLKYTTTSFTGMIASVSPVFTALLGALILRERPTAKQWIFIVVSILGVLLVSVKNTGGANTVMGCLCLIGAYFSGSFYSLIVRRMSRTYSAFELTYIMFTVGFVFFTGWAFVLYGGETPAMIGSALTHFEFIASVLFLGIGASVGAYMLVNYSLAKLPVAQSSIFCCLTTIVSVLSGVIIMGDEFTIISLISFLLILVGVYGVNRFADHANA